MHIIGKRVLRLTSQHTHSAFFGDTAVEGPYPMMFRVYFWVYAQESLLSMENIWNADDQIQVSCVQAKCFPTILSLWPHCSILLLKEHAIPCIFISISALAYYQKL